ncbi:hypothetical protein CEXT_705191 [Caerostris extrusa]|uniref:Secreted protein n=1 Tax=Caerostris extrusa TaxID=172846 RepID=A0AAV4RP66_CAEEX|nr:hypothetical protein CEXT_705191 [Caerostris extrusa]
MQNQIIRLRVVLIGFGHVALGLGQPSFSGSLHVISRRGISTTSQIHVMQCLAGLLVDVRYLFLQSPECDTFFPLCNYDVVIYKNGSRESKRAQIRLFIPSYMKGY